MTAPTRTTARTTPTPTPTPPPPPTATAAPLRVLGVQIAASPGAIDDNCRRAAALIRANPGHHLYVLPELSCTGYADEVLSQVNAHAEAVDEGAIARFFSALARDVTAHVCYALLRRTPSGGVTICQAVAGPHGELVCQYDKMHLCDMGACSEVGFGLQPGTKPVHFECEGHRVGLAICYDLRFPELFRELAWREGASSRPLPSRSPPRPISASPALSAASAARSVLYPSHTS